MADSKDSKDGNQVVHIHYVHHIHHYPGMGQFPGMPVSMPGTPQANIMTAPGFHAPQPSEKDEE